MSGAALYIHIPFCRAKCIYCDFYSITELSLVSRFVSALQSEIKLLAQHPAFINQTFTTIYFGGGTPSLMTPDFYRDTLECLRKSFHISPTAEISFEANPGTLLDANLGDFHETGLGRITIGIQSFIDSELHTLSRIHSSVQAILALQHARDAGFNNIGLDLIFGIPKQTIITFKQSLQQALAFKPEHISMYGLTIENGTALDKAIRSQVLTACDEELEREMYILGMETLTSAGYEQYEISNYSLPGRQSQHNSKYWDGSPYLGLGPSAHSFDGEARWWNLANVQTYIDKVNKKQQAINTTEILTPHQHLQELILLGFRRSTGISLAEWKQKSGIDLLQQAAQIIEHMGGMDHETRPLQHSASDRLLVLSDDCLALSRQGLLIYDHICEQFFSIIE